VAGHAAHLLLEGLVRLPKATNIRPACMLTIQGMERRSTKASGSKLSCAVRLTCAARRVLQLLVVGQAPAEVVSRSASPSASKASRSCTHCCTAT
jgi:hypothetical protein